MSSLRRAFVAVVPPADAIDHVDAALARVRAQFPQLRYAPRAQWHVTVRFLGRVDDADALVDDLRAGVAGAAPFVARLGGAGAFARARSGTVVWVGMRDGVAPLTALARAVGADEPYRPHLTVARTARPTDLRAAVAALDAALEGGFEGGGPGPSWTVGELVVFESDTRPGGAVHAEIARIGLPGGGSPGNA